jgi:hypothetical protein
MITLAEYRADLDSRISSSAVSGFWTDAMKDEWINQAGQRVFDYKPWKWLELALKTHTRDQKEYYDYPVGNNTFKSDSIFQITVDGEEYPSSQSGRARQTWTEYQMAKQADSEQKIFASHNGFYFLHPIPEDDRELSVYGLRTWRKLEGDDDVSEAPAVFKEPIVRIALASCLRKAKKHNEAKTELVEVIDPQVGILAIMWEQENDRSAKGYVGEAQSSRW